MAIFDYIWLYLSIVIRWHQWRAQVDKQLLHHPHLPKSRLWRSIADDHLSVLTLMLEDKQAISQGECRKDAGFL